MELAEQTTRPLGTAPRTRPGPRHLVPIAAAPADPSKTTIVGGRYRLVRRLGAGGSATVFRADDLWLRRPVALKLLHPALADDPVVVERFRREAWIARRLRHEQIAAVLDWGVADGAHYIAMECVPGRSLRSVLQADPAPQPAAAIGMVLQILEAARFTHDHGVVHRDLKPENVIVDPRGRVKIIDFGVAVAGRSSMTPAGSMLGTVNYMSPELLTGGAATAASDLYSIGVILYELLAGRRPFEADLAVTVAMAHVDTDPEPPSRFDPAIAPALDAVVMRALEKSASRRFRHAGAFVRALERATDATAPSDGSITAQAA